MYISMEPTSSFWTGFSDCTEEAIAFLLENENISEGDPIITGLRMHLQQKQQELEFSSNRNQATSHTNLEDIDMDTSLDRTDEGYNSSINTTLCSDISCSDLSSDLNFSVMDEVMSQSTCSKNVEGCNSNVELSSPVFMPYGNTALINKKTHIRAQTKTVNSFTPIMHTSASHEQCHASLYQESQRQLRSTSTPSTKCNLATIPCTNNNQHNQSHQDQFFYPFQDPLGLAILTQNNPEIASVAQELCQLLSEEYDDSILTEEDVYDIGECQFSQSEHSTSNCEDNSVEIATQENKQPQTTLDSTSTSVESVVFSNHGNNENPSCDKENVQPRILSDITVLGSTKVSNTQYLIPVESQETISLQNSILRSSPQNNII